MKAIQIVKPNDMQIIDMPMPVIDEVNNVLVKIKVAGICGSDVGIFRGTNAAATYPRVIGHEIVGVIAEVGPNVKDRKVGERVIIDQVTSCELVSGYADYLRTTKIAVSTHNRKMRRLRKIFECLKDYCGGENPFRLKTIFRNEREEQSMGVRRPSN